MCLLSHSGNIYLSQRNHLLTQENAPPQRVVLNPSITINSGTWLPLPRPMPNSRPELLTRNCRKGCGERKERVQDRKSKTLPKLRTPYPSHSKSSVDWILHSAGCLPKIKYKIHNFLFNCPLALVRISRRLLGKQVSWVSAPTLPPQSARDYRASTQLLWTWVCFPVCKTKKGSIGEKLTHFIVALCMFALPLKLF